MPPTSKPAPRPQSALSVPRSQSSLSVHRPASSASSRPLSRLSARSNARHTRSRLIPFAQALVHQITGLEKSTDVDTASDFREAVEYVVKKLETTTLSKGAASVDMKEMDRQIHGCVAYRRIQLSQPPTKITEQHASSILYNRAHPSQPPPALTWASIVAEEPFEGEHWEGVYGLPPGFVRRDETQSRGFYDREKESERLDWDSRWSTPSLSPLNSDDLELDADQEEEQRALARSDRSNSSTDDDSIEDVGDRLVKVYGETAPKKLPPQTYAHRQEFEALQAKQYWREGWKGDVDPLERKSFDIGDASTLGPTLNRALQTKNTAASANLAKSLDALVQNERYINEEDAVREVLLALQGMNNILFQWKAGDGSGSVATFTVSPLIQRARKLTNLRREDNFVHPTAEPPFVECASFYV
ncbi:hypothetical protein H0H87_008151 [Tephrocybe sp. NHM501043]|nr:hypothetical protein H0H87_008151 [Tephrocybe sp. NHM501043]